MLKILIQIFLTILIIATIKLIKDNKIKYPIESYIISIVIYTIVIMLLF
ncbi:MAG: hypothetical protein NC483_00565 [Ruminococcus sp.]|nr:hypothetical protein [Ruminococcus sp.]